MAPDLLEHLRLELGVERLVASEVARVEQCGLHLHVPLRQAAALADVAQRMADDEPPVPQAVEDHLADGLDERVHLPRIEEEEIDVGRRVQLAAPVAALADHGAALVDARVARRIMRGRLRGQEAHEMIDRVRVRGDQREPTLAGLVARLQLGADPGEEVAREVAGAARVLAGDGRQRRHRRERRECRRPREHHGVAQPSRFARATLPEPGIRASGRGAHRRESVRPPRRCPRRASPGTRPARAAVPPSDASGRRSRRARTACTRRPARRTARA